MLIPRRRRGISEAYGTEATDDVQEILRRLRTLPIKTWSYKFDHPTVLHLGPMAQDFADRFGLSDDDRTIHPIDSSGVALAAIQALAEQVEALQEEVAILKANADS